jgi:hypothetical protein
MRKWRLATRRFVLTLKVSSELWYDTRADGTKLVNLFRIGWAERDDSGVKIACACLLWVSVHFAF